MCYINLSLCYTVVCLLSTLNMTFSYRLYRDLWKIWNLGDFVRLPTHIEVSLIKEAEQSPINHLHRNTDATTLCKNNRKKLRSSFHLKVKLKVTTLVHKFPTATYKREFFCNCRSIAQTKHIYITFKTSPIKK